MEKKAVSGIMLTLLLVSVFVLAFNIQPVKASGTIYIRADGSIDPPTAPITSLDNVTYTLTGNITSDANGIVIERDSMTLDGAGYTLRGPEGTGYIGITNGTYLVGRTNVTISNLHIRNFGKGFMLDGSMNCTLVGNVVTGNGQGTLLASSSNNSIIRNRFAANHAVSIECYPGPSSDLRILENNFTDELHGIWTSSPRNTICNNTVANCSYGIELIYSGSNYLAENVFSNAGLYAHSSFENVAENNVVNGKPLVYLEDAFDFTVNDAGQVILVNCDNIRVENLSLSDTSYPLQLWGTNNSRIANNNITANNWNGIQLYFSSNNTLEGNNVAEKHYRGVHFYSSPCNTLRNNSFSSDNYFNFFVDGSGLSDFIQDVDTSNTVNGKPTYYWINKTDTSVPLDAGYVALVNCTRMTVQNLTLTKNAQAIMLAFTTNSTVTQNNLTKNEYDVYLHESQNNSITGNNMTLDWYGVHLRNSSYNTVQGNKIKWTNYYGIAAFYSSHNCIFENMVGAWYGVLFESSSDNLIYHNSFVGSTTHQFFVRDSANVWDDGYPSGGNYWSDYVGVDVKNGIGQDLPGSDGLGDTPYIIDASNTDHYPLFVGAPPPPTYSLTITTTVGGTADPAPGTYSYTANSQVQVTAIPSTGYMFDHWELDSANAGVANPYTVLMDRDRTLKAVFELIPPPLSVSINPLSASINVGQSVTFTSTASGGYPPYSYHWYLNGAPVSGATLSNWTFTSTTSGIYYVYLKVTDSKGTVAQSETARITVATVPVGGYSLPIQVPTKAEPVLPYIALVAILTISLTTIKRKTKRKTR